MATPDSARLFEAPKFRQVLASILAIWVGLVILILLIELLQNNPASFSDPLLTPFFYLLLFGGSSLWVVQQYRRRHIDLRAIIGDWPAPMQWRRLIGLWLILFMFSLGAFQVSFALLSYVFPELVEQALQDSIFLTGDETAIPWLYNLLMFGILVIAAPILEEFLFRGFLLHRWGTRWNVKTAVILSSVLFGILHSNIIGLTAFGVVMALLYLRSGSLGLVVVVHSLNNAIAASLEVVTRLTGNIEVSSLAAFRSSIWLGIVLLAVSTPFLVRFLQRHWSLTNAALPYFANRDRTAAT
jgi:membrane protease YdiL (CAAX protease family)